MTLKRGCPAKTNIGRPIPGINTKYRNAAAKKTELVHMLNATGFAIGRVLIAIIENYQQKDGSVKVPDVLQKYLGGLDFIKSFSA
ncbi:MAG: Serine-tRNA ligase [Candidatus Azambacteria bacterium GW2011_GWD2_46_48]|uniref:Seryl-tRNA(Ser/Sec) synthetase n=1 Tax=Candidatus Azambacteria bacterium GW2011_GWD2_46_48 TaxID=1618623 RepID=A0A0G1QAA9_9BACT|nr:MAG: Serine-tRNA ligase [Candidatus Azambacteria bacterium GW2011_GWD2_46_48]